MPLLCVIPFHLLCQETGKMIFNVKPSNAIIRLDTMKITKLLTPVSLNAGTYTVKVWAPKMKYYEGKLKVEPNKTKVFGKSLTYCDEYRTFKKQLNSYRLKNIAFKYIPVISAVGYSTFGFLKLRKWDQEIDEYYDKASEAKNNYENAISLNEIGKHKTDFNNYKSKYEKATKNYNNFIIYSCIGTDLIFGCFLWRKASKLKKAKYKEDPKLSQWRFNINLSSKQTGNVTIAYNF
ncbi:MAG: hypothetical protein COA57_05885 [Flavobacteriales bacterium]|nr:MAG: hypothetical protein COA57_05885 [Flavobacteriales bacterium]